MKNLKFFAIAIMAICLVSCGNKKNPEETEQIVLSPETTKIKGDLGDYFEVVEKEYIVTDDWGDMVSIEVKRTDTAYAFDLKGVEPYGTYGQGVTAHAGFGIEILDENGNVIEKTSATASGLSGMYSSDDMKEALKLKAGETGTVRWTFHFDGERKPAKFRLTSAYEEVDSSDWDSNSSDADVSSSSSISDDESSYTSSDDDDDDDYSTSYGAASKAYNKAMKEASKEMKKAMDDASKEMNKAMKDASKEMKKAMDDAWDF